MPVSVLTRKFSKTKKNPVRLNCVETTDYTIKSAVNPGYMIWYTGFVQFAICTVFPLAVSLPFVQLYSHSLLILLRRGFVWRKYQEGEWSFTSRKRKEERETKIPPFVKISFGFYGASPDFTRFVTGTTADDEGGSTMIWYLWMRTLWYTDQISLVKT